MTTRHVLITVICILLSLALCPSPSHCQDTAYATSVNDTASSVSPFSSDFIPTDEWQTVREGQAIPPGLWVRMDLTTGEKTARLLPEDDEEEEGRGGDWASLVVASTGDNGSSDGVVVEEEESAREGEDEDAGVTIIPPPADSAIGTLGAAALDLPPSNFHNPTPAQLAALKAARAARLRELSAAFQPTDDLVVMKQLLSGMMAPGVSVDDVVEALELMEQLVHQVDNAMDFVSLGGLDLMLQMITARRARDSDALRDMESAAEGQEGGSPSARLQSHRLSRLQEKSAWVLGTAAQNNPHVKREAMKEQSIDALLSLLRHQQRELADVTAGTVVAGDATAAGAADVSDEEMLDSIGRVQAKALYALSSLLRSTPEAQDQFHAMDGTRVVQELLSASFQQLGTNRQQQTVYGKSIALLSDLVQDRLVNSVNASSQALFEQLTDSARCDLFALLAHNATRLMQTATSPSASTSTALHALHVVSNLYTLLQLLVRHQLCLPPFLQSPLLQDAQALSHSLHQHLLAADDEARKYQLQRLHDSVHAFITTLESAVVAPPAAAAAADFSSSNSSSSQQQQAGLSVLEVALSPCSSSPLTGFHRDSYCSYSPLDTGRHLVCAVMTPAFLSFTADRGNDLSTPRVPDFPGLKPGDRWCVCAGRWQEALDAGLAPPVVLEATHSKSLDSILQQALLAHAHVGGAQSS